jgi:hypothetical protein
MGCLILDRAILAEGPTVSALVNSVDDPGHWEGQDEQEKTGPLDYSLDSFLLLLGSCNLRTRSDSAIVTRRLTLLRGRCEPIEVHPLMSM